jgi:hypothetical protein
MKMTTSLNRKLWGLFPFSPLILFFTIVPFILPISARMHANEGTPGLNPIDLGYFVIGNSYIIFVIICFIVHLNRLETIPNEKRALWKGLIVLGTHLLFHFSGIFIFGDEKDKTF